MKLISIFIMVFIKDLITIEIQDALNILKKLKFDSPTIFSDTFNINYKFFSDLLNRCKNMNLTYCNIDKKQIFENKKYFNKLEKFYKKNYNGILI